jgi:hypothetical protein
LVRHGDYGEFPIRWDSFGRTVWLWIFKPLTESLDPAAHRRAIERAIESSKGCIRAIPCRLPTGWPLGKCGLQPLKKALSRFPLLLIMLPS